MRISFIFLSLPLVLSGCAAKFHGAIMRGENETVRRMISQGADVEQVATGTDLNETPLYTAAATGNLPAAKMLIAAGAKANQNMSRSRSPLSAAALWGNDNMVDFLLSAGANPNVAGDMSPLLLAACFPNNHWDNPINQDVVELLLEHGANPDLESNLYDKGTHTALSCAVSKGNADVTRLLLKHDATVNQAALSAAAAPGRSLVKRLLDEALAKAAGSASPEAESAVKNAGRSETPGSPAPAKPAEPLVPGFRLPQRPQDFALVVGVERYASLPEARFAERDASAVAAHMEALGVPPRNIIHLAGPQAGYASLKKYLESWLPKNVTPDSRVYFFFSGHGAPETETRDAYLVPWDGDPSFLKDTAYPLKRLYEKLDALRAKEVVVAMDACFSGAGGRSVLAKGARPLVAQVTKAAVPPKLTIFAAAAGDQITSTLEDREHGTFTYYFLQGLGGGAKDSSGRITARGLFDYLKPRVQDAARRQNRDQEPVLDAQGDRVIIQL